MMTILEEGQPEHEDRGIDIFKELLRNIIFQLVNQNKLLLI